jgi:hypothetical protein
VPPAHRGYDRRMVVVNPRVLLGPPFARWRTRAAGTPQCRSPRRYPPGMARPTGQRRLGLLRPGSASGVPPQKRAGRPGATRVSATAVGSCGPRRRPTSDRGAPAPPSTTDRCTAARETTAAYTSSPRASACSLRDQTS